MAEEEEAAKPWASCDASKGKLAFMHCKATIQRNTHHVKRCAKLGVGAEAGYHASELIGMHTGVLAFAGMAVVIIAYRVYTGEW